MEVMLKALGGYKPLDQDEISRLSSACASHQPSAALCSSA
jgi:hypothetical protein